MRARAAVLPAVLLSLAPATVAGPAHAAAPATAVAKAAAARCAGADALPKRSDAAATRRTVLCLLNRERAAHRLTPLRSNVRLRRAAKKHSNHMVRAKFFDHTTPAGTSMTARITRSGYTRNARSWAIGENLAWGTGGRATPRQIVSAWMASPGHRANVLSPRFREIGIGIAHAAPVRGASASGGGATYTTDFGARA